MKLKDLIAVLHYQERVYIHDENNTLLRQGFPHNLYENLEESLMTCDVISVYTLYSDIHIKIDVNSAYKDLKNY